MKENTKENLIGLGSWAGIGVVLAGGFMLVTSGEPSPDPQPQQNSSIVDENRSQFEAKRDAIRNLPACVSRCNELVAEDYPGQFEAESWTGPNLNRNGNG